MSISGLNHFTIRCKPDDLAMLVGFYGTVLDLQAGDRPTMPRPGYWLYNQGRPIVHLYASIDERESGPTGALDHISFSASGLEATRARLREADMPFDEFPLPGTAIHQIFLRDPLGLKIELTFDLNDKGADEHAA